MSLHTLSPLVVIACKVFQHVIEEHLPEGVEARVRFLDYGLHRVPDSLTMAIQDAIDALEETSVVVLGYGLCGNGLHGVKAREHTLLIPRTDDCIAILLGSRERYLQEFEAVPGTYYLSKGWLEVGSDPLKEYQSYAEKYGPDDAQWIMDQQYQHYERLVLVAQHPAELEAYRPRAREVARYCERWGMRYEEILGSEDYIKRLLSLTADLEQAARDFLFIPPGAEIRQEAFLR